MEVRGGVVVAAVVVAAVVEMTFKGLHLSSDTSAGSENERVISDQTVERNRGDEDLKL
jgi:hypothetical protein